MSALYTSSAERWRTLLDSNSSRILRRGSVALRPLSFRLCTGLIDYHYRLMTRALFPLLLLLLASCGVPRIPGITPYKPEIQQGNYVSQEMIAQLKPGMTREQVRFILGTPLITPIFHADRWDYVFTRRRANSSEVESRRIAVFFEEGKLKRVEGDVFAAAGDASTRKIEQ